MPSLTPIHDFNILIWTLEELSAGDRTDPALLEALKSRIEQRQTRWGLTEREAEHTKLVDHALLELEVFGLVDRTSRSITPAAEALLERLRAEKSRRPVVEYFAPRLLAHFDDVGVFLGLLDGRGVIRIPRVPGKKDLGLEVGHRGRGKAEIETPEALDRYIEAAYARIKEHLPNPEHYAIKAQHWKENSRGSKHYVLLRTIIRDAALWDFRYGDVKYKVIRDRLWYLGVLNWSEHLADEFPGEVCYPLYSKAPLAPSASVACETAIGTLHVPLPSNDRVEFERFIGGLWRAFSVLSRKTIGYVAIPDLRDATCRSLAISDYTFNQQLARFARACSEGKLRYTCNWESAELAEITQKRLPIEVPGIGIRKAVSIHRS